MLQLAIKEKNQDVINQTIGQLQQGRDNASGLVTLAAAPATTTTVQMPNCSPTSCVFLSPANAFAAAEVGTGDVYVDHLTGVQKGQFVISHSSSSNARVFYYRISGG